MHKTWPLIFVSFASGIGLACCKGWLLLLLLVILFLIAAAIYPTYRSKILWIVIIIGVGMGYYDFLSLKSPLELPSQEAAQLTGIVQDIPYYDGQNTSFTLKTDMPSPYQKKIRIVCLYQCRFNRGDLVKLQGDLKPPTKPGNPGEFDYPSYLAYQGIYYNLTVKSATQAKLINPVKGPIKWIDAFRSQAEQLTQNALSKPEAAVLLGMLLGGRAGMEQEQYSDFQKTGIVHLFSVGGLHVGFLLVVVGWLTSLIRLGTRGKFWAGVFILLVYGTMVAWPAPVIRAVIMGVLGLLAYYSGRENSLLNALAISGLVILLISPDNLFNLSFQLTILASWGLIYLFPLVKERLPYKGWGWDMILIPICAEVAVLPLVAYYFNLFTPISLFTNILITYLAGGAVILGFIAFLLAAFLPFLATLLLYPAGLFIELILLIVQWTKMLPGAYIWVATPAVGMIALYYIAIFAGILGLKKPSQRRYVSSAIILLMIFMICLLLPGSYYDRGILQIVFIDVGQGDSILIKTPQGKFVLVDGGGSQFYDVAAKKLLPYLHYRGIRYLDMIINTHPDIDHEKGLESVAEQIEVNCLGLPASISTCKEYQPLRDMAARRNIPVFSLGAGQYLNLENGVQIKVLHPERDLYDGQALNQESVVLQVRYGEFSALLTGDIPSEVIPQVLAKVDLPISVVKVPHHGSKGSLSPGFYQKLHPRLAVISVAANNPFGHPNPSVLEALAQAQVEVLRTDQDGAVMVSTDGEDLMISRTKESGN